jgi:hypothetical protein
LAITVAVGGVIAAFVIKELDLDLGVLRRRRWADDNMRGVEAGFADKKPYMISTWLACTQAATIEVVTLLHSFSLGQQWGGGVHVSSTRTTWRVDPYQYSVQGKSAL